MMQVKKINSFAVLAFLILIASANYCYAAGQKSIDEYLDQARQYELKDQYKKAVKEYTACLKKHSKDQDIDRVYFRRGQVYLFGIKKTRRAIADAKRAIKKRPLAEYYFFRGQAYFTSNKWRHALKDFDKAIEIQPESFENAENYSTIAECYLKLRDYGQAIRSYSKALELEPDNVRCLTDRGVIYYDLLNYRAAKKDWFRVLEIDPDSSVAQIARENLKVLSKYIDISADDEISDVKDKGKKEDRKEDGKKND